MPRNHRIAAAIFAAAAALPLPAFAQSWYAGISAGQSKTDDDLVRNRESTIIDGTNISTRFDDKDSAWKGFVGFRLNPIVSFELSYADLGEHSMDTRFNGGTPPQPAGVFITREIKGWGADVVLTGPISDTFSVFGRVGAFRAEIDASAQLSGNVVFTGGNGSDTFRATSAKETVTRYGVGLQWNVTPRMAIRAEYERLSKVGKAFAIGGSGTTGEADVDMYTAGVLFRF